MSLAGLRVPGFESVLLFLFNAILLDKWPRSTVIFFSSHTHTSLGVCRHLRSSPTLISTEGIVPISTLIYLTQDDATPRSAQGGKPLKTFSTHAQHALDQPSRIYYFPFSASSSQLSPSHAANAGSFAFSPPLATLPDTPASAALAVAAARMLSISESNSRSFASSPSAKGVTAAISPYCQPLSAPASAS